MGAEAGVGRIRKFELDVLGGCAVKDGFREGNSFGVVLAVEKGVKFSYDGLFEGSEDGLLDDVGSLVELTAFGGFGGGVKGLFPRNVVLILSLLLQFFN